MKPKILILLGMMMALSGCNWLSELLDGPASVSLQERLAQTPCDTEPFRYFADAVVLAVRGDSTHGVYANAASELVSAAELNNSQRHDCQRLITGDRQQGLGYGPLVALFVSPALIKQQVPPEGRVVAELVNYGDVAYTPLGIPTGYSCLWIGQHPERPHLLVAGVIPPDIGGCASTLRDGDLAVPLQVRELTIDTGRASYPSTGRWMWDETRGSQFIGMRCGNAWCELGRNGFVGTDHIASAADVPGRFDRQLLAVTQGSSLEVSGLTGVITPGRDNELTENPSGDAPGNRDLHVATLSFLGEDMEAWHAYATKFALDPEGPWTDLEIFMNPADNGVPPDVNPLRRFRNGRMADWKAVRRCDVTHSGSGTVRWAWSEDDEGFWVPCDKGCCMVRTFAN